MNHKRGRRKKARAGCLLCKPHKSNGAPIADRAPTSARRMLQESVKVRLDDE